MSAVSIIVPAYNAAEHISEAVQSVLAQSYRDWELIVIDDGSTDKTVEVLAGLRDERIKVLRQGNAGVSAARNAGLDAASGRYVTFLDADDVLPVDALEARVVCLEANPDVDIVNGRIRVTRGSMLERIYEPSTAKCALLPRLARLEESVFFGPFYMIRSSAIGQQQFRVGVTHCEDLIFFLELAHSANLTYIAVDEEVYEYRLRDGSAMSNLDGLEHGYMALIERASRLDRLAPTEIRYLRRRIALILLKCWLRKGKLRHAVKAYRNALSLRDRS